MTSTSETDVRTHGPGACRDAVRKWERGGTGLALTRKLCLFTYPRTTRTELDSLAVGRSVGRVSSKSVGYFMPEVEGVEWERREVSCLLAQHRARRSPRTHAHPSHHTEEPGSGSAMDALVGKAKGKAGQEAVVVMSAVVEELLVSHQRRE